MKKSSHYKVYTRLAVSKIHGIGVMCIIPIKKGISIFYGDEDFKLIEVDKKKTTKLPKEIKKLYKDFCPLFKNNYQCPETFGVIPVSWYLNHSKTVQQNIEKHSNRNPTENKSFFCFREK